MNSPSSKNTRQRSVDQGSPESIQTHVTGSRVILFTNPSARAGYDTRSIFKRSLTDLNSEFSFSSTSYFTKAEEPSLPYYLPLAGGRIIGFIPFPRVSVLCEMQSVSSRIWTRVAVFISNDNTHYTTGTSTCVVNNSHYPTGLSSNCCLTEFTRILFLLLEYIRFSIYLFEFPVSFFLPGSQQFVFYFYKKRQCVVTTI